MDCLFLINPASGGMEGQRLTDILNRDFAGCGHNIHAVFINQCNPLSQVSSLVHSKELVVIAGGDGTVSMLTGCLAMLNAPPPFAIIPLGTGNDLARNTGWLRIWQEGGLDAFFTALSLSKAEPIDVWGVGQTHRFICYAGTGLDAKIISFVHRYRKPLQQTMSWHAGRRLMTKLLYVGAAARYATIDLVHAHDTAHGTVEFFLGNRLVEKIDYGKDRVVLMASIDSYAGGGRLSENASRNDGIFEVYRFPSLSSYLRFLIKSRLGGKFRPEPAFRADRARLPRSGKIEMQIDGEPTDIPTGTDNRTISLLRVIPVLIPPEDFGAREKIRKKSPAEQKVKPGISPALPGAAAEKQIQGEKPLTLSGNRGACRKK